MPEKKRLAIYDLARRRMPTIGVLLHQLGDPFVTETLRGIQKVTEERGYDVLLVHSQGSIEKEVANTRLLFDCGVDGLLTIGNGVPIVFFGGSSVTIDHVRCGYLGTEHLIRQGCRRIVLVTPGRMGDSEGLQYAGFRQALRRWEEGVSGERLIPESVGEESGVEIAERVLRMEQIPDGLFIADDQAAVACLNRLAEAGVRVPEDVAIVGLGNDLAGRLISPALTTVNYPGFEIGRKAASTLLDRLRCRRVVGPRIAAIVPPALIIRKSSLRNQFVGHS